MRTPARVLVVFGTRPEAIKLAPLVCQLRGCADLAVKVCVTAQHREMLDQVLGLFGITPDYDLDLMQPNQGLAALSAMAMQGLDQVLAEFQPDLLIVQGDTTTTLVAALAAYYRRVPVFHVEAGLRTDDLLAPWPEEGNRRMVTRLAARHFAATPAARDNLLGEGVPESDIRLTGNTVIDALVWVQQYLSDTPVLQQKLGERFPFLAGGRRMVLVTAHRRENFGEGFQRIGQAIAELAARYPAVDFVFPVHPNPNVQEPVRHWLAHLPNVALLQPLEYQEFVFLMGQAYLILTDSGGVQEEAPFLGKPVLLMRDCTERPEAVAAGSSRLVGTDRHKIVTSVVELLEDPARYSVMARKRELYGDGCASARIVGEIRAFLGLQAAQEMIHA
ncbi:non-hydrolyzing UDP-N-acetylglucosamine 2-epimerase [Azonexus sp.]|uniref:non-hydrolyzing UDP-N-acetylglucosamine 2-epimerase n=1 Tax=Azonexus sp. TaxID=1872668 RepID=UPI0035AFC4F3